MILLMLLVAPVLLLAQVDSIPQPGSIIDIFTDLNGWLSTSAGVAGVTIFLTALVTNMIWKTASKIAKQILAVGISLVLVVIGNLVNIGFMANGLYDAKNVMK